MLTCAGSCSRLWRQMLIEICETMDHLRGVFHGREAQSYSYLLANACRGMHNNATGITARTVQQECTAVESLSSSAANSHSTGSHFSITVQ